MRGVDRNTAKGAVRHAMRRLAAGGERCYSLNVPEAATRILLTIRAGPTTSDQAWDEVKAAIIDMRDSGELEAPTDPRRDWKLLNEGRMR